ncbi:predicted GPI-anchored protein 58 [Portunus trituberculatus]|uniref:predicted GPI-anchored protein 58 n=1 Tax=Portunus trituberculatus TaxID=210409 RepID=UPI001E1CEF67|nr:predicted GPI-anchored protein 58 [Portunus trituberculatus]
MATCPCATQDCPLLCCCGRGQGLACEGHCLGATVGHSEPSAPASACPCPASGPGPAPQPAHKNQPQSVPASPQPQPVSAPDNKPQSMPASPWPQPVTATVQPALDNKPQSAPASPRLQPVSVPVHPSPQSAPDSQPQGVPASSRPQRVQPPAPVQPPLPLVLVSRDIPLSVPDRTPPRSGSPSVQADLVLDDMDTDEEEWVPTATQTLDRLQAKLAAVTEGLA